MASSKKENKMIESVFDCAGYKEFKDRILPCDYIRTYRKNAGLTQAELAKKLGVTRSFICDIEHNKRGFSKKFAIRTAAFFKISINHLI